MSSKFKRLMVTREKKSEAHASLATYTIMQYDGMRSRKGQTMTRETRVVKKAKVGKLINLCNQVQLNG